jgi:hypothetical protein
MHMEFDVRKGSRSRAKVDAYLADKKARGELRSAIEGESDEPIPQREGVENPDVTWGDVERLLDMNLRLAKERGR